MTLDVGMIAFVGYTTPGNEGVPVWKREGVLELVESKVSRIEYPVEKKGRMVNNAVLGQRRTCGET